MNGGTICGGLTRKEGRNEEGRKDAGSGDCAGRRVRQLCGRPFLELPGTYLPMSIHLDRALHHRIWVLGSTEGLARV